MAIFFKERHTHYLFICYYWLKIVLNRGSRKGTRGFPGDAFLKAQKTYFFYRLSSFGLTRTPFLRYYFITILSVFKVFRSIIVVFFNSLMAIFFVYFIDRIQQCRYNLIYILLNICYISKEEILFL